MIALNHRILGAQVAAAMVATIAIKAITRLAAVQAAAMTIPGASSTNVAAPITAILKSFRLMRFIDVLLILCIPNVIYIFRPRHYIHLLPSPPFTYGHRLMINRPSQYVPEMEPVPRHRYV